MCFWLADSFDEWSAMISCSRGSAGRNASSRRKSCQIKVDFSCAAVEQLGDDDDDEDGNDSSTKISGGKVMLLQFEASLTGLELVEKIKMVVVSFIVIQKGILGCCCLR